MMTNLDAMIEADLHGLVDGQIELTRRVGVLRRLAASPTERGQVEAWQAQGELLRSAFAGVDREPVPAMLNLKGRPQLHCVPADDAPLVVPSATQNSRRGPITSLAVLAVIAGCLMGSWVLLGEIKPEGADDATPHRRAIDIEVARRGAVALEASAPVGAAPPIGPPTDKIPDLHSAGFGLVGAETVGSQPPTMIFRYQNKSAERVVLSVARVNDSVATRPTRVGSTLSWRSGDRAYALTGTVDGGRLRTIASTLRQESR